MLAEDGGEEVKSLLDHAGQLWPLVSGMEEGTGGVAKQSESVENGDNNNVGIENDRCNLEHVNAVVVASRISFCPKGSKRRANERFIG